MTCVGVLIGAAGTDQGPQHIPPGLDSNDRVAQFGAEVATAITAFTDTLGGPALLAPINYPATGVKWGSAVVAKVAYDASVYELSEGTGYSRAYDGLKKQAAACSSAKFTVDGRELLRLRTSGIADERMVGCRCRYRICCRVGVAGAVSS